MGDTRPLAYRRSHLFRDYPLLVNKLISLTDEDMIEIEFEDFEHARNFRKRLYTFRERYGDENLPLLRIKVRDKNKIGTRNFMFITRRTVRKIKVKIYRGTENQHFKETKT